MNSKRPLVPGETIPLEIFPEVFRRRAEALGTVVLFIEGIKSPKMDAIMNASDEDLRKLQILREMTYARLDKIFTVENL